ncbi:uncharacterized protein BCN122_III0886 [Burkholderia cenocepacia]|nr:uncharacterized protein BCN122_III0886 [Burkholderia cenocepacia]
MVRSRHDTRPRRVPWPFRAPHIGGKRRVRHIFGRRRALRFLARRAQSLRARERTEAFSNFLHKSACMDGDRCLESRLFRANGNAARREGKQCRWGSEGSEPWRYGS